MVPVQMPEGVSVLINSAEGLTATVTFWLFKQLFAFKVSAYTTFTDVVLLLLVSTSLIPAPAPLPAKPPLIPATEALFQV